MERIIKAFFYSLDGLKATYKHEAAFRQEVWLGFFLVPLTLVITLPSLFKAYLLGSYILILLMEILNSAIEAVVDMVMPDIHELAKRAKDMGSCVVLLAFVNLLIAWGFALCELFS